MNNQLEQQSLFITQRSKYMEKHKAKNDDKQEKNDHALLSALEISTQQLINARDVLTQALMALTKPSMHNGQRNIDLVLTDCFLAGATLSYAELDGADLSSSQLQGAELFKAKLNTANLSKANLQSAFLSAAQLQDANLAGTRLMDSELYLSNIRGANLSYAQLQNANLSEAVIIGANLSSGQLQGANLSFAQVQATNLSSANLDTTRLYGIYFNEQTIDDLQATKFPNDTLEKAIFESIDHSLIDQLADERRDQLKSFLTEQGKI